MDITRSSCNQANWLLVRNTMTETKPADGYVTAVSSFTVENTAEIQKHEMKDDVTKVQISKTDITGEKDSGCKTDDLR